MLFQHFCSAMIMLSSLRDHFSIVIYISNCTLRRCRLRNIDKIDENVNKRNTFSIWAFLILNKRNTSSISASVILNKRNAFSTFFLSKIMLHWQITVFLINAMLFQHFCSAMIMFYACRGRSCALQVSASSHTSTVKTHIERHLASLSPT